MVRRREERPDGKQSPLHACLLVKAASSESLWGTLMSSSRRPTADDNDPFAKLAACVAAITSHQVALILTMGLF